MLVGPPFFFFLICYLLLLLRCVTDWCVVVDSEYVAYRDNTAFFEAEKKVKEGEEQ